MNKQFYIKLIILSIYFIFYDVTYSQIIHHGEILIRNESTTNTNIRVIIYPISMIFNSSFNYDLMANERSNQAEYNIYYYHNGVEYKYNLQTQEVEFTRVYTLTPISSQTGVHELNIDGVFRSNDEPGVEEPADALDGVLCYGKYKIIIYTYRPDGYDIYPPHTDSLTIDIERHGWPDQYIVFKDNLNIPRTTHNYFGTEPIIINEQTYQIQPWITYWHSQRNHGDFDYNQLEVGGQEIFPQDSRRDCNRVLPPPFTLTYQNQNHGFVDGRSGNLTLNLTLVNYTYTPTENEVLDFPTQINVMKYNDQSYGVKKCFLTLGEYATLHVRSDPWHTSYNNRFIAINNYGNITLRHDAEIWLESHNKMNLFSGSDLRLDANSKIIVYNNATFCNFGGTIRGPGKIVYEGAVSSCIYQDMLLQDSTNLVLLDSASWTVPDNSIITLEGNITCLKMNPNSEIKFGANSKLILQNGAHLVANDAKFTSVDPNTPWDGIYLSDISNDTITNCTIENAVNGINITDKNYSFYGVASTEISNCTFSNTTNSQLTSGVYVNNSTNVLINGNNFTSSELAQGFANGVMIEYCPSGSPLVVDNNIDKVLTGIFVSQSSPYIARNTITGVTGSGKGIELDNSNGTLEYNIVNNFVNSYTSSYSSPYLLKNTFYNASTVNVDLYVGSIPVIRPVNSGTLLRWLSGNNIISGSPTNAGISLVEESYPVMDSGFNKIMVGTSDYMSGAIPYSLSGELNAKMNYWYDDPPESQRMAVTGGTVLYDPTFDGSSLPPTDYTELNDIGFGLYDTVFVETLGGDTPSPENLFSQAYQCEKARQYLQAINLYKQVVTNYRNSAYASVSLSRIFNCLEKKIGTIIDYQQLQTYMSQLRTNNQYPAGLREIAEDFIIKSKVKQGLLQSAINDYQTMYEQNQNNHKGIHALINKEILITMLNDTGDVPKGGTNIEKLANHKLKLLSIITGRDFTSLKVTNNNQIPHEYKLYQNYPNPFNPKTTIKYDLPKDGFVLFKVYDILGKELLSLNEYKQAGTYTITLDGSNYASGLYFYRLETGSYVETKKMVLIK